jgi:hypothetical protein
MTTPRRAALSFAVFCSYLLLAVLMTYPLVTHATTRMIGHPSGDTYEYVRHVWWYGYAVRHNLPLFDQTLLNYPDGMPSWYLWGNPLRTFPAWLLALVLPLPLAWNIMAWLFLALNGWAMAWVLRRWLGNDGTATDGAAWLGGVVFMTFPTAQGHLFGGHVDLLALWGLPLVVAALFNAAQPTATARACLWLALAWWLAVLGNFVLVVYALLPISVVFGGWWLWQTLRGYNPTWRGALWRIAGGVAGGVALSVVGIVPAVLELLRQPSAQAGGSVAFSADALAWATPSFLHPLWRALPHTGQVLGVNLVEGAGYWGLISVCVIALGAWAASRAAASPVMPLSPARPPRLFWAWLLAVAWLLSLGPLLNVLGAPHQLSVGGEYQTFVPLPWAWLQNLPLLNVSRTPGRFNLVVGLCLAALVGYAWYALAVRPPLRQWLRRWPLVLCAGLIAFDVQLAAPLPSVPADLPPFLYTLGAQNARAVLTIPTGNRLAAKTALYAQTAHTLPLIGGHITRDPLTNPALLTILEHTLDPARLRAAGADLVLVLRDYDADGALSAQAATQLGPPLYADARFAVYAVPASDAAAIAVALPPAPFGNVGAFDAATPTDGWWWINTASNTPRRLTIQSANTQSDGVPLVSGDPARLLLPASAGAYTRWTLTAAPACRLPLDALCPLLTVTDAQFVPSAWRAPVAFADGITLNAGALAVGDGNGGDVQALLWWQFAPSNAPTDQLVRFVKVLAADGAQVFGVDDALFVDGDLPVAPFSYTEAIALPPLRAGDTVYMGWYRLPDVARLPILRDDAALPDPADDRTAEGMAWLGGG